jgi:RNA polymerase sigma factor (sigma-70 family)
MAMMMLPRNHTMRPHEEAGAAGLQGLADRDCLLLARAGHRGAQGEIVERHLPVVYRLCLRLTRDRDRAADATQEAFARALAALGTVDPESSVRAWLCAIACNLIRDSARRAKVRRVVGAGRTEDGDALDIRDPRQQPVLDALAGAEQARLVEEALDRLEPDARAIVVLRDIEGLSYGEIAQALGLSLGTVKSRVHRARMELKDAVRALAPSNFDA